MYHLIFRRKNELNSINLTGTQSFPPFGEVVLLFSTPHFRSNDVLMVIGFCEI